MINVGGDDGWVIQQYAPIKMKPGDTLNFTWDKERGKLEGGNDVWDMKTADAFNSCNFTNAQFIGINSVFVQLTNESDFYFACSIGDGGHCRAGQKVKVSLSGMCCAQLRLPLSAQRMLVQCSCALPCPVQGPASLLSPLLWSVCSSLTSSLSAALFLCHVPLSNGAVPAPPPEPDDTLGSTRSRQPLHGMQRGRPFLWLSPFTAHLLQSRACRLHTPCCLA